MTNQINKHWRESDFIVEDWVYVTQKGWITERFSLKLNHQVADLYHILSMKKHFYIVNLLKHMKMNNIFYTDCLRKTSDDSLLKQIWDLKSSTEINEQLKYEVDRVLASWVCNNILQYQVTWEGYDSDSDWYNTEDFIDSSQKLKNFHDVYLSEAESLQRLQMWLNVYRDSKELNSVREDNLTVKKTVKKQLRRKT